MPIYVRIEKIDGNVTAKGHEKWIEVGSFQFGVGRGIGAPTGRGTNRETSAPSLSEITVTKESDETSPLLFQESCTGKGKKVEIHFTRTTEGQLETYMEYTLSDTLISGYTVSSARDSGRDTAKESIAFNYTKLETKYTPYNKDHTKGSPVPAAYDLAQAAKA